MNDELKDDSDLKCEEITTFLSVNFPKGKVIKVLKGLFEKSPTKNLDAPKKINCRINFTKIMTLKNVIDELARKEEATNEKKKKENKKRKERSENRND